MTQSYVHWKCLSMPVNLRPEQTFHMPEGSLLRVVRPLYGLSDAGDAWWSTIWEFLMSFVYFQQTTRDSCLVYGNSSRKPSVLGVYVDDIVFTGTAGLV